MLIGKTTKERQKEADYIVYLLQRHLYKFKSSRIFINWNISCPNTGHDAQADFINSFEEEYKILSRLGLPILVKVGWQFPIDIAKKLQELQFIYGFVAINTIPFNELPRYTKEKYFKKDKEGEFVSPLDKYQDEFNVKGRGGVSGHPIRYFALAWIKNARKAGITKPIIGGGGIMNLYNVWEFKKAGATAIALGSGVSLRFWNLPLIIWAARVFFKEH
jgi:dihydroorotate dehydrogenase